MSAREIGPMAACMPGGSCPDCNPKPERCPACGDVEVEERGELCKACKELGEEEAET